MPEVIFYHRGLNHSHDPSEASKLIGLTLDGVEIPHSSMIELAKRLGIYNGAVPTRAKLINARCNVRDVNVPYDPKEDLEYAITSS